eukprot:g79562.t1
MAMCTDDENSEPEQAKGDQRGNTTANPTPETVSSMSSWRPCYLRSMRWLDLEPADRIIDQHREWWLRRAKLIKFKYSRYPNQEIEQLREAAPEQVDEDGLEAEDHEKATSEVYDDDVLRGELD